MSSHHIVREKQEPALLILGLDSFPLELLGQLLEWNPTVITTPKTAVLINGEGIKIDYIVTDDVNMVNQSDIKQIAAGVDAPVEAALKYLITHNYPAVNVITDDFQLKDYLYFATKINLVIFHGNQKIYSINSGFSKWKPANEKLEILTRTHELQYSGLESLGDHIFRTTHDGFFSFRFDQPFLFIAETL